MLCPVLQYWGYNLLIKVQFGHNPYYDEAGNPVDVEVGWVGWRGGGEVEGGRWEVGVP